MWRFLSRDDDEEVEYVGNIWGWKFSLFGAVLLFGLIGLAYFQAQRRGVSIWEELRRAPEPRDTLAPGERPTPEGLLEDAGFDPNPG